MTARDEKKKPIVNKDKPIVETISELLYEKKLTRSFTTHLNINHWNVIKLRSHKHKQPVSQYRVGDLCKNSGMLRAALRCICDICKQRRLRCFQIPIGYLDMNVRFALGFQAETRGCYKQS